MSWLALLKIMLELILVGIIGPTCPNDHVDPTLVDLMQATTKKQQRICEAYKEEKVGSTENPKFFNLTTKCYWKMAITKPP